MNHVRYATARIGIAKAAGSFSLSAVIDFRRDIGKEVSRRESAANPDVLPIYSQRIF